ncbi:hypothetical protein EJV44_15450 [Ancylobacter aquaticus]|nr:hypothetical protein EJV44_15450 [Ancylobacter aquaticus]
MSTFILLAVIYGLLVCVGYLAPMAYADLSEIKGRPARALLAAVSIIFTLPVVLLFFSSKRDRAFVWRSIKRAARIAKAALLLGPARVKATGVLYDRAFWWG